MDQRLLRPRGSVSDGPDTDPPVQLKAEDNSILAAESGTELTTE